MAKKWFVRTELTGGGDDSLDAIDGSVLNDNDFAFVFKDNTFTPYLLDAMSGQAESSPDVIAPNVNAGAKRWIRQAIASAVKGGYSAIVYIDGSKVYARDYKGDLIASGTAGVDDATTINSALDSLTSGRTWKERAILVGDFVLSQGIELSSYTILDLTHAKVKLKDGANVDVIVNSDTANGNTEVEIVGGIIDGNKANQSAGQTRRGIMLTKVTDFKINGVTVKNVGTSDSSDLAQGVCLDNCERGEVVSVHATSNNHYGIHLWECENVDVRNCFSYENGRHGFGGSGNQKCKWIGNCAIDNADQGFWFRNLVNCLITNNHAICTDGSAEIGIQLAKVTDETTGTARNNAIVGNVVVGFKDSTYGLGIHLHSHVENTTVKSNVVEDCRVGAKLVNAHYTDIIANRFANNTEGDILDTDGSSTSVKIADNYCINCQKTSIETCCKYGKIVGNYIKNPGNGTNDTYYGIYYRDRYYVDIKNNTIDSDATNKPRYGIYLSGDWAHHVIVKYNRIFGYATTAIGKSATFGSSGSGGNEISNNEGYVTENSGSATISNGNTSVTVSHGLVSTPSNIQLTGTHSEVKDAYVTNVGSTSFEIHVDSAVSADRTVYWKARV